MQYTVEMKSIQNVQCEDLLIQRSRARLIDFKACIILVGALVATSTISIKIVISRLIKF